MTQTSLPKQPARILRPLVFERRVQPSFVGQTIIAVLLWLTTWLALSSLDRPGGGVEVAMEAQIPHVTHARLYYDAGRGINPPDSVVAWVRPGRNTLRFDLPPGDFGLFRLDPAPGPFGAHIDSISVRSSRHDQARPIALAQVRVGAQIADLRLVENRLNIVPAAGATQPQLLIEPETRIVVPEPPRSSLILAASAGGILLLLLAVWHGLLAAVWSWSTGVALGVLVAFLLAWSMAWGSPFFGAVHPDEIAHIWSFQYYLDHLLPAAVDDPVLVRSISVYGFSYLFELDVVYAIAARTAGAFTSWFANDTATARCFNLALLFGLGCMALRNQRHALCLAVILLSPQIWYVFSYFNADAFPLTLSLVAASLVADEDSSLSRYIDGRQRLGIGVLVVGLAVGLLLISKRNYLPLVPILGLWLAVRHLDLGWRAVAAVLAGLFVLGSAVHLQALPGWPGSGRSAFLATAGGLLLIGTTTIVVRRWWRLPEPRAVLVRLATVFTVAIVVAAPRVLYDLALNGTPGQKAATLEQIAEIHAGHGFKPSQLDQDFAYFGRAVAQRGFTLHQVLFSPYHWVQNSLNSSYGVYGYFVAFSPQWLLRWLQLLTLAVAIVAGTGLLAWNRSKAGPMLLLVIGGAALIAVNSILHSWTFDHQAQGRYLFPGFTLLALMLGTAGKHVQCRLVAGLIAIAFLFACISYTGTGLPALTVSP